MIKSYKHKYVSFLLLSILLASSYSVTGQINTSKKEVECIVTSEKAKLLLQKFYEIENNYNGFEKIKNQIEVLLDFDVIPAENLPEFASYFLDEKNSSKILFRLNKKAFFGPMFVSHFVPFGHITGTSLNDTFYYNHSEEKVETLFGDFLVDRVVGRLLFYLGFSFNPVFVTVYNIFFSTRYSGFYLPFFEFMFPCFGTSIRVFGLDEKGDSVLFFEYNLDFSLFTIFRGFSF